MDARGAELERLHFRAQGAQLASQRTLYPIQLTVQHSNDVSDIGDPVSAFGGKNPRGIDQSFRLAQILREGRRFIPGAAGSAAKLFS